jgi:hypothetical protein
MERHRRRKIALSLVFCVFALVLLTRTAGFETIRALQFLLIFVAGVNGGVALAQLKVFQIMERLTVTERKLP